MARQRALSQLRQASKGNKGADTSDSEEELRMKKKTGKGLGNWRSKSVGRMAKAKLVSSLPPLKQSRNQK